MKIPNWIREFFLLEPRPPKPVKRVVVQPRAQPRKSHRTHQWHTDTLAGGTPGPEVVRKKVRVVRPDSPPPSAYLPIVGDEQIKKLPGRWIPMMVGLEKNDRLRVTANCHYGKLRGVDILREARHDFRRAGIPVNVKLCGQHGFISLAVKD